MVLKVFLKLSWIHAIGALVNVDEVGARSGLADCLRRSNESVRDRNNDIASLYTGGGQSKPNRIRSAGYADTMRRVAEFCEVSLKFFHPRAANESGRAQRVF